MFLHFIPTFHENPRQSKYYKEGITSKQRQQNNFRSSRSSTIDNEHRTQFQPLLLSYAQN